MQKLRQSVQFLVYSNLFIGLAAALLAYTNRLLVGYQTGSNTTLVFVFFATVFIYSFLKFRAPQGSTISAHQQWAMAHPQLHRNIMFIALAGTVSTFAILPVKAMLIMLLTGAITAFYASVDIPFTPKGTRLRKIGWLKTPVVAAVWSVTTVCIPLVEADITTADLLFLLLRRFLFIVALTIPFEIKDMADDKEEGIITLPMRMGVANTKLLAQVLVLLLIGVTIAQFLFYAMPPAYTLAVIVSLLITLLAIQPITETTGDIYYYVVLDGMMVLQFVLVYAAALILEL